MLPTPPTISSASPSPCESTLAPLNSRRYLAGLRCVAVPSPRAHTMSEGRHALYVTRMLSAPTRLAAGDAVDDCHADCYDALCTVLVGREDKVLVGT